MNYRNYADMARLISRESYRVPEDVDLVVGVPRSGIIPAAMIATIKGLPLTDLDSFLSGHIYKSGLRFAGENATVYKKALIVDDSVATGNENRRVRAKLQPIKNDTECVYTAVYVIPGNEHLIDLWFELVPGPRLFEWNILSNYILSSACVDIDGVLCRDPTEEENDDGENYIKFINGADPLIKPRGKIGWLVTSRLEKFRVYTVNWLKKQGIEYEELIMLNLPNKEARQRLKAHGKFKANVYSNTPSSIFIESAIHQAQSIATRSGKPVVCTEDFKLYLPEVFDVYAAKIHRSPRTIAKRLRRFFGT